jgi:hypothetical protein
VGSVLKISVKTLNYIVCDFIRVVCRSEMKLKLTHNNVTLSLDCVKIKKCIYIYIYIYTLWLKTLYIYIYIYIVALRPIAGHGLLILEVSRSHTRRTTVGRTLLDE